MKQFCKCRTIAPFRFSFLFFLGVNNNSYKREAITGLPGLQGAVHNLTAQMC